MAQSNLGKVMLTPRGNYSAGATYNMLDFVLYGGASFVALENDLSGVTPSAASPSWQLLAAAAEEITVVSQEVEYAAQAAADYTGDPPESGWSSEIPTATNGNYLWTRIITTYSDGSSFTAYLVAKNGVNGSGAVSSVNGVSPDASGNVLLNIGSIATVDSTPTAGSTNLVTSGGVNQFVYGVVTTKENISNKVSAWSAAPNDNRYPSEKLVKNSLNSLSATIAEKSTVSVSATGTSEDEVQYITIDGVEKKLAGGGAVRIVFRVFCNVGDTVTVTDGTTSESKTLSAGTYLDFEIPNLGTWTASCGTLRKTAQIDYYGMYYADLRSYVFGIKRNTEASDTRWERTDDSIGYTATASVGSTAGSSDFDDKPPYNGIARTTVAGTEDVMVRIPKFYIKRWIDSNGYEHRQISNMHLDGFTLHGAFKHNNSEQDYIYIGAYKTGAGHTSKSGVSPLVNITRAAFRSGSRAKGEGWSLLDPYAVSAVEWLYLIEFADNNSQEILGNGVSSGGASVVTGDCDGIPNLTGKVDASTTRNNTVYRGIEGFYGNGWEMVDGLNINNGNYYVSKNQADFADDTSSNYTSLTYARTTNWNNSFITSLGFDENNPEIALPTVATGGSATTYYCDGAWSGTGWCVALRGGGWELGSSDGLFTLNVSFASSIVGLGFGSRLLYIP